VSQRSFNPELQYSKLKCGIEQF